MVSSCFDVIRHPQCLGGDRQPGFTAADDGKNDASTTKRFSHIMRAAVWIEH